MTKPSNPNVELAILAAVGEFAGSLNAILVQSGVTTWRRLAELAKISPRTLRRWVAEPRKLSVKRMVRLAMAVEAVTHVHVSREDEAGRWRAEAGLAIEPGEG